MKNKTPKSPPSLLLGLAGGVVVLGCVVGILVINLKPAESLPKDNTFSEDSSETEVTINSDEHGITTIQDVPYGPEMVLISGGTSVIGGEKPNLWKKPFCLPLFLRLPRKKVSFQAYYLGQYEVTIKQFKNFVKDTGYKTDAEKDGLSIGWKDGVRVEASGGIYSWKNPGFNQNNNHPVVCVSWNDAKAYCEWLSKKTRIKYRLPKDEEWEYACRGGTETKYFWGDKIETGEIYCNMADQTLRNYLKSKKVKYNRINTYFEVFLPWEDGYKCTSPVGSFGPNSYGLFDIQGNISEWCEDKLKFGDPYTGDPCFAGIDLKNTRVLRGGTHDPKYWDVSSAARGMRLSSWSSYYLGFRVARDLEN